MSYGSRIKVLELLLNNMDLDICWVSRKKSDRNGILDKSISENKACYL